MKPLIIVLMVFLTSSVVIGCTSSTSIQPTITQTQLVSPISTSLPEPTVIATGLQKPTPTPPTSNTIYFGTVEGNNALFITSDNTQYIYKFYFSSYEYFGKLYLPDWIDGFDFNFKDVGNPVALFSVPSNQGQIEVDYGNEMVYVSGYRRPANLADEAFVHEVNLETGDNREVWSGAPGYIDYAYGNHLIIKLWPCYRCSPSPLRETVVVNTITGAEKDLGEVGDIEISDENGTVSYRYLTPIELPCHPVGEGCDGFYTDYEPTGELFAESLP